MIDTHCHIDDPQYSDDLDAFLRRQREGGVSAILVPGVTADSCRTVFDVCRRYPGYLFPALGLHPEEVREDWKKQLRLIHNYVVVSKELSPLSDDPCLVAIGEVGLDYHFSTEFKEEQKLAFREQLGWAMAFDLPVMVHSRDATEDTLAVIKECCAECKALYHRPLRGVMHCFSGSRETALEYVHLGWKLGIGGVLTFRNSRLGEQLCPTDGRLGVPLDALVLETDAPYMAPVPHRGEINESRWMIFVAERLAALYSLTVEEVIKWTTANARALFFEK